MPEIIAQITAPHFCAGLVMRGDRCTEAAPILAWAIRRTHDKLRGVFCSEGMATAEVRKKDGINE